MCRSDTKEIISQQKYNDLKKLFKGILVSLSQETKKELISKLDNEIKGEENIKNTFDHNTVTKELKTQDLMFNAQEIIKNVKELKAVLVKSKVKIEGLEKKMQEQNILYQQLEEELKKKKTEVEALWCRLEKVIVNKEKTSDKNE